ncbi:hypothetical protein LHP98_12745 [Rhodobacter sp. Har01]|uniref:hypothetical protein n=1 Tax=Rhodobacter sp. Har01 TaxID=2883999 RepID=UPI001D07E6F8|nr:hypothetical protein [Rhodobacter sp. Har01]MCB6178992.1 hypothetical protein [Rhodobacter sp. Har01]
MIRALVLLLALAGCVDKAQDGGPEGKPLGDADRAACLAQGGTVGRGGLFPDELCFRPMPDAGKACTRAGDCEGQCMADTMTCSKVTPVFGCYEFMDEQGQKSAICVD